MKKITALLSFMALLIVQTKSIASEYNSQYWEQRIKEQINQGKASIQKTGEECKKNLTTPNMSPAEEQRIRYQNQQQIIATGQEQINKIFAILAESNRAQNAAYYASKQNEKK